MSTTSRCSNLVVIAAVAVVEMVSLGLAAQAATPGSDSVATESATQQTVAQQTVAQQSAPQSMKAKPARLAVQSKPELDRSGNRRIGKASFYAHEFSGRKMANGRNMDPKQNNAASRTLPLGTIAKVTNLKTGQSAVVTIEDRGPYVAGRIVDLSPATAQEIGITRRQGITKVEVAPISVPQPDGRVKLGAAADELVIARNVELMQFEASRP